MTDFTLNDLATLPPPEIIETLAFEQSYQARVVDFIARCQAAGIDYTTINLESDPGAILLQEAAYREMVLRARGNDIAREAYLYFADGAALDHLAAFYDVVRLPGETDQRLKTRVILAVQGRSTGGTRARYKSVAMGVSTRVADVEVYRTGVDPTIRIAVFSTDNNGVADAPLLESIRQAVNDDTVRMVNDTITVSAAVVQLINVAAKVWLLPNAAETMLPTAATNLPVQWAAEAGLGRDLTISWLVSKLMIGGMQRVEIVAPIGDVVVSSFTAVRIGSVSLDLQGRGF